MSYGSNILPLNENPLELILLKPLKSIQTDSAIGKYDFELRKYPIKSDIVRFP